MFCYEFPMVSFRPPFFLPIAYCTTWNSITKIQLQLHIGVQLRALFYLSQRLAGLYNGVLDYCFLYRESAFDRNFALAWA